MDKQSRLKVYFGPNDDLQVHGSSVRSSDSNPQVAITLSEFIEPLLDAVESDRTWIRDFKDDSVTISKDLHDVLLAYRKLRKSA